jgi:hypothetical protein
MFGANGSSCTSIKESRPWHSAISELPTLGTRTTVSNLGLVKRSLGIGYGIQGSTNGFNDQLVVNRMGLLGHMFPRKWRVIISDTSERCETTSDNSDTKPDESEIISDNSSDTDIS